MNIKSVDIVKPPMEASFVGDGFRVHHFIPNGTRFNMKHMDPFIMLDYNSKHIFPPSNRPKGVGVHPHRGFETVTLAYKGKIEHHDSSGGGGIIAEGDVQWMTAGSGILHKEYHEKEWSKQGGIFQMVQLWINLPAKDKMATPKYQAINNSSINRYYNENNGGEIQVIAGEFKGVKGTASTFTPINMFNAILKSGTTQNFSIPSNHTTLLLVVEGQIVINENTTAPTDHLVLMANDGDTFTIEAKEDAIILILSGEPINEPIFSQGPFAMNTEQELIQAFQDYNEGKFGFLAD